ncbi:hypothetical protein CDAR_550581 [Caerostris darwini]|uniref:Uncharacterized protein n=1 Tax=Caerostris darwini TaxID=1538125 RepID=A0AAV4X8X7_9ARAC|nr:hypothetical protein CDAR_550581 [Caerostris darwini]
MVKLEELVDVRKSSGCDFGNKVVPKERVSYLFFQKVGGGVFFVKKTAEFDEDMTWKLLNLNNSKTMVVKLAELVDVRKSSHCDFGEK